MWYFLTKGAIPAFMYIFLITENTFCAFLNNELFDQVL